MAAPYRKKLIEVALPLDAINREAAREKSIRHGHPSTLHLWWARRPLAACRAVLFSSLVDDPSSDPHLRKPDGSHNEDLEGERRAHLFNLIEELVKWENSNDSTIINAARAEIARSVASRKLELGELNKDQPLAGGITPWDLIVRGQVTTYATFDKKSGKPSIIVKSTSLPSEAVNAFLAEHAPPVLDPFCGGGSIPLEAQRLGLRAFASDLNPVPVLITKALIEIPPKFAGCAPVNPDSRGEAGPAGKKGKGKGQSLVGNNWIGAAGLAEDVRYYGKWMRDEAEKRIGHLYPKVKITKEMLGERVDIKCHVGKKLKVTEQLARGHTDLTEYIDKEITVTEAMAYDRPDLKPYVGQELTVIAWIWARTVSSPNPAASGAHVPLVRSFWLSPMRGQEAWVEPVIAPDCKSYRFEIQVGPPVKDFDPGKGTKLARGAAFRCVLTNEPMSKEFVRGEFQAKRDSDALMAVVAEGNNERVYLSPNAAQEVVARSARPTWRPEEEMDQRTPNLVSGRGYGIKYWYELFTARQLVALTTFSDLVLEAWDKVQIDGGSQEYSEAVATYLAFMVNKLADKNSALCTWDVGPTSNRSASGRSARVATVRSTFGRQALPMMWDFAEVNVFSESVGSLETVLRTLTAPIEYFPSPCQEGFCRHADAGQQHAATRCAVSTDPPYYDNIGYADLSDFFYVWLRRTLSQLYPPLFRTLVTPKAEELIATPYRHDGSKEKAMEFFELGLGRAFERMREVEHTDYPLTVYYAFKQAESDETEGDEGGASDGAAASTGWETMLEGLIKAGFAITGTWPMRTELGNRMIGMGTNALASSIVLVCRPRATHASMTTRKDFVAALKKELPAALRDLQSGNIAPVDLAQAAIGPGMAVYSRYSKVVNSDGSRMPVRTALQLINQALDEVLSELESEFDSETRWAIKWFEQHAHDEGAYGTAETLSTAMAVSVKGLVEAGFVKAGQGKVRLLRRAELAADWDPTTDTRLTIWEVTQYLIRRLEEGGDAAAAELLRKVGSLGEVARDLAYRLYSTCERKKWAEEARSYNGLVVAWGEIGRISREAPAAKAGAQAELFSS